jgi:two-component system, LuxR family, sensor kinase FixL
VLNLLRNAVEAVQGLDDGHGAIAVVTAASCDAVEVSVRDNGIGLPEQSVDVFAPFYSTKAHGLGMGLSISRSIIEAHRGELWATRNTECGSTFHFTLPLGAADERPHRAPAAEIAARRVASR